MAIARPRTGRALVKDDANEERDIWKGLVADGKKVDALGVRDQIHRTSLIFIANLI